MDEMVAARTVPVGELLAVLERAQAQTPDEDLKERVWVLLQQIAREWDVREIETCLNAWTDRALDTSLAILGLLEAAADTGHGRRLVAGPVPFGSFPRSNGAGP